MLRLIARILEAIGKGFDRIGGFFGGCALHPPSPWEVEEQEPYAETLERARQTLRPYHYSEFVSKWCQQADLGKRLPMRGLSAETQAWLRSLDRHEVRVLAEAPVDAVRRHVMGTECLEGVRPAVAAVIEPPSKSDEVFGRPIMIRRGGKRKLDSHGNGLYQMRAAP